jgi:hypothetical protein
MRHPTLPYPSNWRRLAVAAWLGGVVVAPGCQYRNQPLSGAQACALTRQEPLCPEGYQCGADNRCWRGQAPPSAMSPQPDAGADGVRRGGDPVATASPTSERYRLVRSAPRVMVGRTAESGNYRLIRGQPKRRFVGQ